MMTFHQRFLALSGWGVDVRDEHGDVVATFVTQAWRTYAECERLARLIAAAPELLEALRSLVAAAEKDLTDDAASADIANCPDERNHEAAFDLGIVKATRRFKPCRKGSQVKGYFYWDVRFSNGHREHVRENS